MAKGFKCPRCSKPAPKLAMADSGEMVCIRCLLLETPKNHPMRNRYEAELKGKAVTA